MLVLKWKHESRSNLGFQIDQFYAAIATQVMFKN